MIKLAHLQAFFRLISTSKVREQEGMVEAEWREEEILMGICLVHGLKEVGGEDRETFVEISRLIFVFRVAFDVIGQAQLRSSVGEEGEGYEEKAPTQAHSAKT